MILIDAGPLIAVVKRDDQHHAKCTALVRTIQEPMGTVWPVLAEAIYLLNRTPGGQDAIWGLIDCGLVQILGLGVSDVPRIRELMRTYADLPMDLADAALIRVAEREGANTFFTIDKRDFSVYRLHGKLRPKILP